MATGYILWAHFSYSNPEEWEWGRDGLRHEQKEKMAPKTSLVGSSCDKSLLCVKLWVKMRRLLCNHRLHWKYEIVLPRTLGFSYYQKKKKALFIHLFWFNSTTHNHFILKISLTCQLSLHVPVNWYEWMDLRWCLPKILSIAFRSMDVFCGHRPLSPSLLSNNSPLWPCSHNWGPSRPLFSLDESCPVNRKHF